MTGQDGAAPLAGQAAIVTGGATGIGFHIARRMLADGARLMLAGLTGRRRRGGAWPARPAWAGGRVRRGPVGARAAVHTVQASVAGKTETILVNGQGLPLYYYSSDAAAKSAVTGRLATLWPPLTCASLASTGLTGKLAAVTDVHGDQVAYNGHLLYTFVDDQAGQVTGQGVQGFFVATPGLTPVAGSPAGTVPAGSSGGGYGY